MTQSIGRPLLSERSIRRQAAACARISSFGYHLKGIETSSVSYPRARSSGTRLRTCSSAPPSTKGTCASHTSTVRIVIGHADRPLCGEPEVDDVAVLDDVLLALQAPLAVIAADGHRPARDQRIVCHDFGPDESTRDVGMDFTGGILRGRPARNGPGAALVFTHREERHVAEQVVAGADHA